MSATGLAEPRFTLRARQDLGEIWDYTAERWGTDQADRCVSTIVGICEDLAAHRLSGLEAGMIRDGYRTYRSGSHIVFFRSGND